eukprot:11812854-Ditylum_brightwellii.AAC.1
MSGQQNRQSLVPETGTSSETGPILENKEVRPSQHSYTLVDAAPALSRSQYSLCTPLKGGVDVKNNTG